MTPALSLSQRLQGKTLLIFDFDGTVTDTTPVHAAAFVEVLAPLGVTVDYAQIAGMKTRDAMRKCLATAGRTLPDEALDALVEAKQLRARALIAQGLAPLPGVDAFLRWARPRFRIGMATSGSRGTVTLALKQLGYQGWFDPLVCADDVSNAKPDPEGLLKVLQLAGTPAEQALVFEDSAAGFLSAQRAGIACVDVTDGKWCADSSAPKRLPSVRMNIK